MGSIFSPRVPANTDPASSAGLALLRFAVQRIIKVVLLLFGLLLSPPVVVAQTTPQVDLESQPLLSITTWYILVAVITFLVQTFLIAKLLTSQVRRRQAEIENQRLVVLAESERKRLEDVISNVPGIVWEVRIDPTTRERTTTFISDYAEKLCGYTTEEWISTPNFGCQIVHEEDRERVKREADAVCASGQPARIQFRWIAKDGHVVWVESNLTPLLDESGTPVGVRGITLDVTQQHLTEEARKQSEELFAKAFRNNPQPMAVSTLAEGRYVDVNESFLVMSGYTRKEVIGHTSLELNFWETPAHRVHFIQQLKLEGAFANIESKFRTKDGSMRVLLVSGEGLEVTHESCLIISINDITERVAVQRALRESEERFRSMADTAPVMIWICDRDRKCTYLSKRWLDFTHQSLEALLSNGWIQRVHPEDYNRSLEVYGKSFDQRLPFEIEYRLRRHDGEYRWIYERGTPRFSPDFMFVGYVGTCVDITERKESEVQLQRAHEELQDLKNQLEAENISLLQELQLNPNFGEIIGQSDEIKEVLFKVTQVATTDTTVLIMGETGTGKELVARAIHDASPRKDWPLIKVNCGALAPSLIESELFGHERGAFTGAASRKLGRFELANHGTIFLDEIGELPLEFQVKLLRVIQENEFERLGSGRTIKIDVRIIAATNRNLKFEVDNGNFREDLWYRLNVYPITVPPLRNRKEDIPLLVEHFVKTYAKKFGKTITSVSPRTIQAFQTHSWPGNVRELANAIERAVIRAKRSVLHSDESFEQIVQEQPSFTVKSLEEIEREYIIWTLERAGWRIEGPHGAANALGLNPSTLRSRMSKLGIQRRSTYAEKDWVIPRNNATSDQKIS